MKRSYITYSLSNRLGMTPACAPRKHLSFFYAVAPGATMRTVSEIAERTCAVACIVSRWAMETTVKRFPAKINDSALNAGCTYLRQFPAACVVSPTKKENRLLEKPLGRWTEKDINRQERRWETLGTLLWSLSISSDIPAFDTHFNREALFRQTGLSPSRPESYQNLLAIAQLRPQEEVERMFAAASFWQWRAHMLAFEPSGCASDSDKEAYKTTISEIAKQAQQTGVAATVDGDFLAQGQPFGKLSGEVQAALAGIAQQRLFSLGWVLTTHDWME